MGQALVSGLNRCEPWETSHTGSAIDGRCVQQDPTTIRLQLGPERLFNPCFGPDGKGNSTASSVWLVVTGPSLRFTVIEEGLGGWSNGEDYFFAWVNGELVYRVNSFGGHSCAGPSLREVALPIPPGSLIEVTFGVHSGGNGEPYRAIVTNVRG